MLKERKDGFSRETVIFSVQKRFESSAYKPLRRSKPKSAEYQAFASTGGGSNYPSRGGSRHGSGKSGGSQGGAKAAAVRAAEIFRVGELAAAAVAPRP